MANIRKRIEIATTPGKGEFKDLFITGYRLEDKSYAGAIQLKNEGTKELMMTLAKGDITQYNEIKRLSVQDYIMKYESFVKDLEARKK